ncbi:hypothetical protein I5Q34_07155 [Streptomyces sp. AV19]|uniref:hypothetical protein n=1 Tax=Streptomyces sp. AV19 TaxID=2793068 RepID=UPI0018FE07EC|nr:hypothetical protein [Streptomyces sp. AV19]MBH1934072.1 hypothetical protein [Streptomyces sp. AV19]MDG4535447.1 hypothetical protein [Streptomyces sp. AV19]
MASSDLDASDDSLQGFKKRVDRLLHDLDASAASHKHISDQKVPGAAYGTFEEGKALSQAYDKVHQQLELLSRMLGDQLEAMGIAVDMADRDYQGEDREHAERLAAIQKRSVKDWKQQQEWAAQAKGTLPDGQKYGPYLPSSDTGQK